MIVKTPLRALIKAINPSLLSSGIIFINVLFALNFIFYSFSYQGIGPIKRVDHRFNKEVYVEYLEQNLLLYIEDKMDDSDFKIVRDNYRLHLRNVRNWIKEYVDFDLILIKHRLDRQI